MNFLSRGLTISALILILLSSACNLPAMTPTPVGTILPTGPGTTTTISPTIPASTETPNTLIPVTGSQEVILQCQFCVNDEPHAVLILPESADFLVSEPIVGVNCITAQEVNDRRILFCRGVQQTTFTFNVCFDDANCFQYPITLDTCPLTALSGNPTPVVLAPANAGVTPTSSATQTAGSPPPPAMTTAAPPAVPTTALPLPTQTLPVPIATTALPLPTQTQPVPAVTTALATWTAHAPQSRTTLIPSTRLPRTALNTPEGFLRWYFSAVWNERDYQDLWDNYLTPSFKTRPNTGGLKNYAAWWSSVQRVDVNSVTVLANDGTHAWVRVNVTFTMNDGRVISNQEYDYDLFFDAARQTWMFDYRT